MVSDWDSAGFIYFYPQTVQPGDLFTMYQQYFFEDTLNNMQLEKQWEDSMLHMQHYRYQQYYKNIEVEAAEFTEHAGEDGYLVFANGKVCQDLNKESTPLISETAALARLLDSMATYTFAWADTSWENELKFDLNDSMATYYPTGQLIFALDNYRNLAYLIPRSKYRLAWKFEIFCLNPFFQKDFFVDANNGQVFREDDLIETDGPAYILTQGLKTIDTEKKWFFSTYYILHTDNNGRDIETRYWKDKKNGEDKAWWKLKDIKNNNDKWNNQDSLATTPHWMASQAWDFYHLTYQREGMDSLHGQVRIEANDTNRQWGSAYSFNTNNGKDYLLIGFLDGNYDAVIDDIGHEFTHGVTLRTAGLEYHDESGALNESFSDIFGFMVERFSEPNGTTDWLIGEDGNFTMNHTRSLQDPLHHGEHFISNIAPCTTNNLVIGQPDTYLGTDWYNGTCDFGGVHTNSGVQNYWFYLLAHGGSGVNNNGDAYNIPGIGIDNAASIAYWNLTNILQHGSQYADARVGAISFAALNFGYCSNEHIQTINAWAAVGVGTQSNCAGNGITNHGIIENPMLYPNPATDEVLVTFQSAKERKLLLYSISGTLINEIGYTNTDKIAIDISNLAKGFYLLKIEQDNQVIVLKLVKE